IADAADKRATPSFIEGQNAEKVLEAAWEAVGAVVVFRVGVTELARGGDEHVFAGLNLDGSVDPGVFARQLDLLGKALFSRRRLHGSGILRSLLGRDLRRGRRAALADELSAKSMWENHGDE